MKETITQYIWIWSELFQGNYEGFTLLEVDDEKSKDYGLWLVDIAKQKPLFCFNKEWADENIDIKIHYTEDKVAELIIATCLNEMRKSKMMSHNNPEFFQVMFPGM